MATLKKIRQGMLYTAGGLGAGAVGVFLWKSNYSLEYKGAITLGITTLGLCGTIWQISKLRKKQRKYESEIKEIVEALSRMADIHVSEKELAARRKAALEESTQSSDEEKGSISGMWNRLKTWISSFGRSADFLESQVEDDFDAQMLELKLKTRQDLSHIKGMELYRRLRNTASTNSEDLPLNPMPTDELYKALEAKYPELAKSRARFEGDKPSSGEISEEGEIDVSEALESQDIMYPTYVS